eukprot:scaffold10899_cov108-Skeletonema_marinoi.AAC.1
MGNIEKSRLTAHIKCIVLVETDKTSRKGAGESNWFWRNLRSLERDSDRISKELDIRGELRNWDSEFPFFHHELIVRYAAGFLASAVAVAAFGQVRSLFSSSKRSRY